MYININRFLCESYGAVRFVPDFSKISETQRIRPRDFENGTIWSGQFDTKASLNI